MSNLTIFPLIKKYASGKVPNPDGKVEVPESEIQEIAFHYTEHLVHHLKNHGFPETGFFYRDMDFLNEVLECILMRTAGRHHPMQDLIDEVMDASMIEDKEEENNEQE